MCVHNFQANQTEQWPLLAQGGRLHELNNEASGLCGKTSGGASADTSRSASRPQSTDPQRQDLRRALRMASPKG
jgi:hypothetical protein